ncbi:hypothetical protein QFZ66_003422 [Streptomyces sp. B4I13]|nr:hypothetical protein [Streptomyces sp. B4I13]
MLDLEPGVDLQERDRAVDADEELHGAGADVAGLLQDGLGGGVQLGRLSLGEERRRGLLDQLLVAALQGAVTGGDDDHVAVAVGETLRLHVPRLVQVALDEALAPAEGGDRLADRRLVQLGHLFEGAGDLETPAAAAERGLDRDGQAVLLGEGDDLVGAGDRVGRAGHERRAGALGDVPGGDLVAEVADGLRRRADPDEPRVQDRLGELGVLREESVTRMDGVRARLPGRVQHLLDVEIAGPGSVTAQGERLIRGADMQSVPVRVGVDGHARDTGIPACPGHADSDFATVGDEHLAHD